MNNKQLLIGGIVFLVVLNILTIGFMFWSKNNHRGHRHDRHKSEMHGKYEKDCCKKDWKKHGKADYAARMAHILELTDQQKATINDLREEHSDRKEALKTEKRNLKKELFSMLKQDEFSDAKTDTLLSKIAYNERREKEALIRHFMQIREQLTAQQHEKFNEMIDKMNRHYRKKD